MIGGVVNAGGFVETVKGYLADFDNCLASEGGITHVRLELPDNCFNQRAGVL
jgi:hypothetical protein